MRIEFLFIFNLFLLFLMLLCFCFLDGIIKLAQCYMKNERFHHQLTKTTIRILFEEFKAHRINVIYINIILLYTHTQHMSKHMKIRVSKFSLQKLIFISFVNDIFLSTTNKNERLYHFRSFVILWISFSLSYPFKMSYTQHTHTHYTVPNACMKLIESFYLC